MTTQPARSSAADQRSILLVVAWIGTLLAGHLPLIIWRQFFAGDASQVLWVCIGSVLVLLALSFVWRTVLKRAEEVV